jgi:CheY-like chemotaxis protein
LTGPYASSISAAPLVLVVEDNEKARRLRADALRDAGCEVIPTEDKDAALVVLRDGPSVDLIVTDIHLGGPGDDRGGIELAQTVRDDYDDDLPMAAYSGKYGENDLSDEDKALFAFSQPRGRAGRKGQQDFSARCHEAALKHQIRRLERSARHRTESLRHDFHSKDFVFADDLDHAEEAIAALGFELRLLSSPTFAQLARPVPVWVRSADGQAEAQVCGQPMLHWQGGTLEEALAGLVEIMAGFAADLRAMEKEPLGPALRLRTFLDDIIVLDGVEG